MKPHTSISLLATYQKGVFISTHKVKESKWQGI